MHKNKNYFKYIYIHPFVCHFHVLGIINFNFSDKRHNETNILNYVEQETVEEK